MKVGLVVPGFSADAADWCIPALRHLVRELAREHEVTVFSIRYPYRRGCYALEGARVVAVGGGVRRGAGTLEVWRAALQAMRDARRERGLDVLHAFWATESGLLAGLAGRGLGVPVVLSLAGGELVRLDDVAYGDQRSGWERLKVRASLRLATTVTAGSEQLLALARRHVPRTKRLVRAPLGVDLALFTTGPRPPRSDALRLVHCAALTPVKDQALLLRALTRLGSAQLDIYGNGPLREHLQRLASQLGLGPDRLRMHPEIDHAQLAGVYRAADAFVLSSRHEAQSMVVLEAAACGTPSVGTAVGVLPELAPDAACTVPIGDADALADALAQHAGGLEEMGRCARSRAEQDFSLERCSQRFRVLYAQVAAV